MSNDEMAAAVKAYLLQDEKDSAPPPPHVMEPGVLPPPMRVRYRPPYTQVNAHDARGDAHQLVVEQLTSKGMPSPFALALATAFVKYYEDVLHTSVVPFEADKWTLLDNASTWCKQVQDVTRVFLSKIDQGEVPLPAVPSSWSAWRWSAYAEKNKRMKMEDRHIALPTLHFWKGTSTTAAGGSNSNSSESSDEGAAALFAVFDGHGGSEVASYACAHFPHEFVVLGGEAKEETMKRLFDVMDSRISVRCNKEPWKCGATAVVAAVDDKKAVLGWCGDAAIFMLRPQGMERLTKSHVPGDPSERKRVEDAGGFMLSMQGEMRVNGVLNVTRALGDVQGRPMIISTPDVTTVEREPTDYALLLMCDGVSEELTEAELTEAVKKYCNANPVEAWQGLAEHLCVEARTVGQSMDNLTVVVVHLRPPEELWAFHRPAPSDED